MPGRQKWLRLAVAGVLAALMAAGLASCGGSGSRAPSRADQALAECRARWHDVADKLHGMDQDPHPSALADRWNSVIATVAYYENTPTAKDCQSRIDAQLQAVTALQQFSEKLRPYDMAYQLDQVRTPIDAYLHEPLPPPTRDHGGHRVKPPDKATVTSAMKTLTAGAPQANADLQPGWQQTISVDLGDSAAVTKTTHDLDFLAHDSASWTACNQALQVLDAAVQARQAPSP